MRLLLIMTMLFLPGYSSARQNADTTVFSAFPSTSTLDLQPVFRQKKIVARRLFLSDSSIYLWNRDGAQDYFFYRFSTEGKQLPGTFIKGGTGAGQVYGAMSGGVLPGMVWTHDFVMNKLVTVSQVNRIKEYSITPSFYSVQLTDSTRLLGTAPAGSTARLEMLDLASGAIVQQYGSLGTPPPGTPAGTWNQAFESLLFVAPAGNKAVAACRFTDRIEIFDLITQKSKLIKGPENFDVVFKPIQVAGVYMMERVAKTRFAFMGGYVTDQFIYLLYSGLQHETPHHSDAKCIYVYDWEGKPVKKYLLDNYVMSIAVSAGNRWLYAYDAGSGTLLKTAINLP